jgi:uncharacterized repeat protein (TIGR01451 family)
MLELPAGCLGARHLAFELARWFGLSADVILPYRPTLLLQTRLLGWFLLAVSLLSGGPVGRAQQPDEVWSRLEAATVARPGKPPWVQPAVHRPVRLNAGLLRAQLNRAPLERTPAALAAPAEIVLPLPDGGFARFRVVEAPVMAPELAAKFPQIKTWMGQGMDDPTMTLRADWTPAGFHAQIISPRGWIYIDPLWRDDDTEYAVYRRNDLGARGEDFICFTAGRDGGGGPGTAMQARAEADLLAIGGTLRTYRLACAATGEYTAFHGGTVAAGQAAIVTAINRVTGVYEVELGIRLVLIANNDALVYTSSTGDPYTNNNGSTMLGENQANIDAVIGSSNYEIGHVFSTGGSGIAGLGVVCVGGVKARGVTGRSSPIGDAFFIDYVAHEIGHQFGGNHTFNSVTSNCGGGNRNASTAYEPGSGTTIMAYAGICGADNVQPNSDPYFLFASFDEIVAYITSGSGSSCPVSIVTGNNPPTVSAGFNYTIPANTPFALTASASDPDSDPLTYSWEERDLGGSQTLAAPDNGASPLFRSLNPTNNPTRTFPTLSALLANTASVGEKLPTTSRTLKFRVTARDHRAGGGGVASADMQLIVTSNAGPFIITSPNSGVVWSNAQTVTWNPAGTATAPVNCANVNIRLSDDGGLTFPYLLAANTPNDGAELVVLPNITTMQARLKVEGAGNVFFDVSNTNFTVLPGQPTPLISLASATVTNETCAPGNGVIDPGETVTVSVTLQNVGSGAASNLVATLRATNGVTAPSAAQDYGAVAPAATVARPFTFTAQGSCGGSITCVFDLTDGTNNLGTVQRDFALGAYTPVILSRTNSSTTTIPASGTQGSASPYPSTLVVSNFGGLVTKVTARLSGLTHAYPDDLDIVLVGPGGQKVMLMSDAGGGFALSAVSLVFDNDAAAPLNDSALITSGTYRPTDFTVGETLNTPAPTGPYGANLAVFNGVNPNGAWSLYIVDDGGGDTGSLASWSLSLHSSNVVCCSGLPISDLSLTGAAEPNPVVIGGGFALTLTVCNTGPDSASAVSLTNQLPAGANFVSATSSQGSVTNTGGAVVASLGALAAGSNATVSINFTATDFGTVSNLAFIASPGSLDPVPANNTNTLFVIVPVDFDGDGLPDAWELGNGLSPTNAADAALDLDGDAFTALQEFLAGTDPADPRNFLGIVSVNLIGDDGLVEFSSVAGRAYDVELTDGWPPVSWAPVLTNVPGTGANILVTNLGGASATNRIYRVRLRP